MERIITVSDEGIVNIKTVDPETNYCHRQALIPNSDLTNQPEDVVAASTKAWTNEVIEAWNLAHPPPTAEELAQQAAIQARWEAKAQAFIDNLPSWAVVGGKFDTMSAAVPTATNAQLKDILVELITTTKKLARVVYWLAKDTEK